MEITKSFSITELSKLTNKTRPTIYKYVNEYENKNFDMLPYSFKVLFDMISSDEYSKEEIVNYCKRKFHVKESETDMSEVMNLLNNNKEKIDMKKVIDFIKEEFFNV